MAKLLQSRNTMNCMKAADGLLLKIKKIPNLNVKVFFLLFQSLKHFKLCSFFIN